MINPNKTLYECHITVLIQPDRIKEYEVLGKEMKWKTSYIAGDPVMGDNMTYFYFTRHHTDYNELYSEMQAASRMINIGVVREKIEAIVYDTKLGIKPKENK